MLEVDLHCHSHFSRCGLHSIIEILTFARDKGMLGIAITDHGEELGGHVPSPFWDRLQNPVPGIRLLKGMECNLRGENGEIDFPQEYLPFADVVLLGLHYTVSAGGDIDKCTKLLLSALEKNPFVDIITHPNDENFPLDFDAVAAFAAANGMALELNNSKNLYNRVSVAATQALMAACKRNKCLVVVNSDAHVLHEIGLDESAQAFLSQARFPREYLANRDAASAFGFIENRREVKRHYLQSHTR